MANKQRKKLPKKKSPAGRRLSPRNSPTHIVGQRRRSPTRTSPTRTPTPAQRVAQRRNFHRYAQFDSDASMLNR